MHGDDRLLVRLSFPGNDGEDPVELTGTVTVPSQRKKCRDG